MRHLTRLQLSALVVLTVVASSCRDSSGPEKPGAPADIAVSAGNAQTGAAGEALVAPIAAKVSDAKGRGVPNVLVSFQVIGASGEVSPASVRTNGAGVAATTWTLPILAGSTARVRAILVDTLSGALLDTASFTATVTGGAPEWIGFWALPQAGGAASAQPVAVTVFDRYNNRSPGVTVTWKVTAGGGTVAPGSSVSDTDGVARTTWTLGANPGANAITATSGSATASASIEARVFAQQLTTTLGAAFGIARTAGGNFVVSNNYEGVVQTFLATSPENKHTITTGGSPVVVAVDAAGALAYVSNMNGWIDIIDLASNTDVAQLPIPAAHALALSPGGDRVYVTETTGKVIAVSTATRQVIDSVAVPNGPWGIAFRSTDTDSLMYVTSRDGGTITEVDTKTFTVRRTFTVGGRPHGLAISPDGQTLYAADNSEGRVVAVSTTTGTITGSVALTGAFGIAVTPDGSTLYVTTDYGKIAVITASNLSITKQFDTGSAPRQIIVSSDGATAWAADQGGWIDVVKR